MIDPSVIAQYASAAGGDPVLAVATAREESGFNPHAVGDQGHSVGLFQENDQGAGAGMTVTQREDVPGSVQRFVDRVRRVLASGFTGTPGQIAAAAQRPADPVGYAHAVDVLYGQYAHQTYIGGGSSPVTQQGRPGSGGSIAGIPGAGPTLTAAGRGPLDVGGAIADLGDRIAAGAKQIVIGGLIIGVVVILGFEGTKKTLG